MPIAINGKRTSVWLDSGSPISIFTIGELRKTLGTNGVHLKELAPGFSGLWQQSAEFIGNEDQVFRDYGNKPLSLLETMQVQLRSNGWETIATIKMIRGNRPSIIDQNLVPELRLQLLQRTPG